MRDYLRVVRDFGWMIVVALFACIVLYTATIWTVPTPNYELFFLTTPLQKGMLMGFWHVQTLFLQVNEHVIVFPMLLIILPYVLFGILPPLTAENLLYVNIVSACCSILGFAAILWISHFALRDKERVDYSVAAIVAAFVGLSLSQWELWTTSNIAYTLSAAATLCAVATLTLFRQRMFTVCVAGALCIVATFSFASGIVAWAACCVCILFQHPVSRTVRRNTLAWVFCAFIALLIFTVQSPSATTVKAVGAAQLLKNTLRLLALPFLPYSHQAAVTGLATVLGGCLSLIFTLCAACGMRTHRRQTTGLLALGVFALLTAVAIAAGRNDIFESRYLGAVYPGGVALIFLLILTVGLRSKTVQSFLFMTVVANIMLISQSLGSIEYRYQQLASGQACLETYGIASDSCLGLLFFQDQPQYVRRFAVRLDSMGMLDTFHAWDTAQWDDTPHPQRGMLEGFLQDGTSVAFNGWATDASGCPAQHIVLTIGEDHTVVAHTRALLPRELPRAFGCSNRLGWSVDAGGVAKVWGKDVSAWVYDESRDTFVRLPVSKSFRAAWRRA